MLNSHGPFPTAGKVSCALVFTPSPKSITKSLYFIVSKSCWERVVKLLPDNM